MRIEDKNENIENWDGDWKWKNRKEKIGMRLENGKSKREKNDGDLKIEKIENSYCNRIWSENDYVEADVR